MDTKKYYTLFNNHLVELLAVIKGCVPETDPQYREHCKMVAKCYQKYKKVDKGTYIDYTLEKFRPHMKYIIDEDPYIFSNEYSADSMKLISGVDFKNFWDCLSDADATKVWQHLHRLYINGCFALGQTNDPAARRIIKNIQTEKRMQAEMQREPEPEMEGNETNANSGGLMQGLFGLMSEGAEGQDILGELFDDSNVLVKLAKQVGEELSQDGFVQSLGIDPNAPVANPMEAIMSLFGQDPHKLESLMTNFTTKFQQKMEEQHIGEADLFKATTEMGQKLLGKIPGMPDLSGLQNLDPEALKNMTPEEQDAKRKEILEQMCQQMNPEQREQFANINQMLESTVSGNQGQGQAYLVEAWEQAKVKHILSLGGEPAGDNELSGEEMQEISKNGIIKSRDKNYINCGRTIMKIDEDKWTEFTSTCKDQVAEINKFMDIAGVMSALTCDKSDHSPSDCSQVLICQDECNDHECSQDDEQEIGDQ